MSNLYHASRIVVRRFYLAVYYQVFPTFISIQAIVDQRQDPHKLRFLGPKR